MAVSVLERARSECLFPLAAPRRADARSDHGSAVGNGSGLQPHRSRSGASIGLRRAALRSIADRTIADNRPGYGGFVRPPRESEVSAVTTILSAVTTDVSTELFAFNEAKLGSSAVASQVSTTIPCSIASELIPTDAADAAVGSTGMPARTSSMTGNLEKESSSSITAPGCDRPPAGAADVPYRMSCVSSVGSDWLLAYYTEPGHAFKRGLRSLDPRQATECSLGTSCEKTKTLPKRPVGRSEEQKVRNLNYLANELRALGVDPTPPAGGGVGKKPGGRAAPCAEVARARYQTFVLEKPRERA